VQNQSKADANVKLTTAIYKADDASRKDAVASIDLDGLSVRAGETATNNARIKIPDPQLWSIAHPKLYVAVTTLSQNGKPIDHYETPFGIRTVVFTADNGMLINDERVQIQGVCNHHDLGALGSAINIRGLERQLEILKEMGCNAIRTSHNPPAPELLDLCDRMGFVVMDEGFDCWSRQKKKNDYHLLFADWHEMDFRALIRRDRNHPCVVLWSIGNEIGEQGHPEDHHLGAELSAIAKEEDPTRPTTSACNNGRAGYNGFGKNLGVFGDNYDKNHYGKFREANPNQPVVGSETASCISSRGEYFFPVSDDKAQGKSDFQMSSYDLYAPRWAMPPDTEFAELDKNPFCAGEFVWTGFDYIGEPTPYNGDTTNLLNFTDPAEQAKMAEELKALGKMHVPSRSSYFGIIDLAGFKKDRFYIYQARWRNDFPMAHILPHWNWPERVGQVTPVHVYTSGDEAELFLNGKSLGKKKLEKEHYRLRWDDVKYEPGELRVIAYKKGKEWAEDTVKTTGSAAKLLMKPDRETIHAGADLSFVTVTVADNAGLLVPRSKNQIQFEVTGPGEIAAVDNGDATSFEPFQAKERKAYNGLALVIVRSKPGETGEITLKATSTGLQNAQTTIRTSK
jgi:beta-galactosidase